MLEFLVYIACAAAFTSGIVTMAQEGYGFQPVWFRIFIVASTILGGGIVLGVMLSHAIGGAA